MAASFEISEPRRGTTPLRRWIAACLWLSAVAAQAQPSTQQGATIASFPRVVSDADVDTLIQIGNLANHTVHAHCFYRTVANDQLTTSDFDLTLLSRQSLRWQASAGRAFSVMLQGGQFPLVIPVVIPPLASSDFQGELLCLEVDAAGTPFNGNHLTGMATLRGYDGAESATYMAIGLRGNPEHPPSATLPLDGQAFDACPDNWTLSHRSAGTGFTIVPCTHDFETNSIPTISVQFTVTNQNLETLTASATLSGWDEIRLAELDPDGAEHSSIDATAIGTAHARTQISSTGGGILVIGQDRGSDSGSVDTALHNLIANGTRDDSDTILLPPDAGELP